MYDEKNYIKMTITSNKQCNQDKEHFFACSIILSCRVSIFCALGCVRYVKSVDENERERGKLWGTFTYRKIDECCCCCCVVVVEMSKVRTKRMSTVLDEICFLRNDEYVASDISLSSSSSSSSSYIFSGWHRRACKQTHTHARTHTIHICMKRTVERFTLSGQKYSLISFALGFFRNAPNCSVIYMRRTETKLNIQINENKSTWRQHDTTSFLCSFLLA